MKYRNKLLIFKYPFLKLVSIILIFTILIYIFISLMYKNKVYAATQTRESYSSKINNYPGYKELIEKLKVAHPNWNFTIFYTGLDWNQVIKNETTAYHGRNLVSHTRPSSWFCSICGDKKYDNGSWRCASESAVSYYMDPRNSLNEDYIFQFENLSYNESIQNIEGVKQILKDVKYMQGDTIKYTKTDGTQGEIKKSYAQVIMDAAKEANISPYHLASRIRQEQGAGTTPGTLATGTYKGYVGYYNFLNIKASGGNTTAIITNGLNYAKTNGLTDPEKSIIQGAKVLAKDYISSGQDTLYLQKFDVDSSDGSLYYFQYMQNLSASKSEGNVTKKTYSNLGLINSSIDFIIPVYENMPENICQEPIPVGIVTQNIKIKGTNVNVRSATSKTASIIGTVNTGDTLLRIEMATSSIDGQYWDKVVLPNGKKGYLAREYIVETADIKNCNDTMIANTSVNLRNGPGLESTTIITTLIKGQIVTRIEKGKYNLDGYTWSRIVLADGRQGYIADTYLQEPNSTGSSGTQTTNEIVKVICNSGLKVREQPGTNQKVLTYLSKNDILTRTQLNISTANGYIWDKIVTSTGIEGYIARGDSKEQYIEVISNGNDTQVPVEQEKNDNFKLENTNLICEPNTSIETIKEKYTDKQIKIENNEGKEITTGNIGTGYKITIEDNSYKVIKLGDVNGDGNINSGDLFYTQKYLLKKTEFDDCMKKACDVNKDNEINSGDLFYIQKYLLNKTKFSI